MKFRGTTSLLLLLAILSPEIALSQPTITTPAAPRSGFIRNMGQIVDTDGKPRPEIRYVAQSKGLSLYLSDTMLSYVFTSVEGDMEYHSHADGMYDAEHPEPILHSYRMDLQFVGASARPEIEIDEESIGYTNYYLAHAPQGITHVRSAGRVTYRNIYPKIDFVIHGSGSQLKYDFVVRPGGRVSDIRLKYDGATDQRINKEGRLITTTPFATLSEEPPYSYIESSSGISSVERSERRSVTSSYSKRDGVITFEVGRYDSTQTLVIDPVLQWSTYYGGTGSEEINGGDVSEIDRSGNVLVTGSTSNASFPTTNGEHYKQAFAGQTDIYIVKMNSRGELSWATIYGGNQQDLAHGISTDNQRSIYIAGHTFGGSFPTENAHQSSFAGVRDAFAVKFDSNGVRTWGTFYGGSSFDDSYGFAIDSSGNPTMILTTTSSNNIATSETFDPTYNGSYDAAIVSFDKDGRRIWGTYVGSAGEDWGYGAATDFDGNINITGWTNSSSGFPVTSGTYQTAHAGGFDAFVFRVDRTGARVWGTLFGGSAHENSTLAGNPGFAAISTDRDGNPIITGMTLSSSRIASTLQTTYGGATDAYVAKFDNLGRRLWSTYIGGRQGDFGQGIAVTADNAVYVTGHTSSTEFPGITTDAFQRVYGGGTSDAFIVKIDGNGSRVEYATYYGGPGIDEGVGISANKTGSAIVAGTTSGGIPVTDGAFQTTFGGGTLDIFLASFCDIDVQLVPIGDTVLCEGDSVILAAPYGYSSYLWQSRTNGAIATSDYIIVRDTGDYWVQLTNDAGCVASSDTVAITSCPISEVQPVEAGGLTTLKSVLPNPTAGPTMIEYHLAQSGRAELALVDMLGARRTIVDATLQAGRHVASFDASGLASGVYYAVLKVGSERTVLRVVVL